MRARIISTVAVLAFSVAAMAQTATLTLESSQDGLTVAPATVIDWTIKVTVSDGDNAGLALISVDLAPDAGNPAFDIPPGVAPTTDPMVKFSRPAGIANPGEGGATTGYIGVQRGTVGSMKLVQIGGGMNTFGLAMAGGTGMGEWADVHAGVGQATGMGTDQVVLTGSFAAPATEGTYTFHLENGIANVLAQRFDPPAFSPVVAATVPDPTTESFTFTVAAPADWCLGDMDCDGGAPDFADISYFVAALNGEANWSAYYTAHDPESDPPPCFWLMADYSTPQNGVEFSDIIPFANNIGQTCINYIP